MSKKNWMLIGLLQSFNNTYPIISKYKVYCGEEKNNINNTFYSQQMGKKNTAKLNSRKIEYQKTKPHWAGWNLFILTN